MVITTSKLVKPANQQATDLETQVAQTLLDLEANTDLKAQLRELHITGAREVDLQGGKKAIIIFVPVPQLRSFQKIQSRLVRELEKKFSGKHFVVIAQVKYFNSEIFSAHPIFNPTFFPIYF
jgi:small subunit ribosomal protein S7e